MMLWTRKPDRDRIAAMAAVVLVHGLALWGLLAGLGVRIAAPEAGSLKLFDVTEPPPPPIEEVETAAPGPPEDAPAPPNLRAEPSPVVAPPPEVRLERPSPVPAARAPGTGAATSAGAAAQAGPGTGAGGTGAGAGGGGAGGGAAVPARQIAGRIANRDYPPAARRAGVEGRVLVRFTVDTSGRTTACTILRSSGNADLDATTCRLIERRFRFTPARNAAGQPVADSKVWEQVWWLASRGGAAR